MNQQSPDGAAPPHPVTFSLMRFISYAQNFEDVMLWRALRHVRGGFYIDVGANDPVKDSVTKAFYDRGWHGINIEPVAAHHADLERERPNDVNLRCALGAAEGSIDLWECELPGLATTDPSVVEQHIREGRQGAYQRVPVDTLAQVCAEHAGGGEIQFLKIDVEGGEESVLAGADFARFRPWIVVVEATRPNSTEQKHEQWEHLLTGARYRFAYADGLNRFYVAEEHQELARSLVYPPNIFDGFILAQQFNAELWGGRAEERAGQLQESVERLGAQLRVTVERVDAQLREAAQSVAQANERALQFSDRATQAEARTQEYVARAVRAEMEARAAEERVNERQALVNQLQELVQSVQRTLALRESQLDQARLTVQQVHASSSWRVTKPLRWISARLKGETSGRSAFMRAAEPVPRGGAGVQPAPETRDEHPGQAAVVEYLPPRAQRAYQDIRRAAGMTKEGQ